MEQPNERSAAQAARWSPRLALASPAVAALSLALGFADPQGGETPLAAAALATGFLGAGLGLTGLFTFLYAREKSRSAVPPAWTPRSAILGIGLNFLAGALGVLT